MMAQHTFELLLLLLIAQGQRMYLVVCHTDERLDQDLAVQQH